jgi:ABC-type Mn2+/Zn2+ transport system ATPase subunit/SAM-dependent methyltransferase
MDARAQYWIDRYSALLDWAEGVHIGRFDGLAPDATLEQASREADNALVRAIYEYCSLFRLVTGFRVLEIGCGVGGLAFRLHQSIPSLQYIGLDISSSAINIAASRARSNEGGRKERLSEKLKFAVGGVSDALERISELETEELVGFDLVIIREVYYLFSNDERKHFRELLERVIRPGGFLCFSDIFRLHENAEAGLQEHLYDRHHAPGDQLTLPDTGFEGFSRWCISAFGDGFDLIEKSYNCDTDVVARTYNVALETAVSPAHRHAYENLAAIAAPGASAQVGYGRGFLFARGSSPHLQWAAGDYHFTAKRRFADAILPGETYGVKGSAWTLLLGRSGAGKTTVLRVLEGELPKIAGEPKNLLANVHYFFLAQEIDLFVALSPIDNVRAYSAKKRDAGDLLAKLGLGATFLGRRNSKDVSGGERQRLAIAQCMTSKADVILLDEPLKGLDKARRAVLFELLDSELRRDPEVATRPPDRTTLVCVDHDFDTIYQRFDFVYEIIYGRQVLMWQKV